MSEEITLQKILIVDDTPQNIKLLVAALKGTYTINIATNGEEGLERASAPSPPDLILLDIMMPGMDGYEVCRQLKAREQTRDIPVIFLTALADEEDEARGLTAGAVDYITKPFKLPIVKARIKTHLELKRCHDVLKKMLCEQAAELTKAEREYTNLFCMLPKKQTPCHSGDDDSTDMDYESRKPAFPSD